MDKDIILTELCRVFGSVAAAKKKAKKLSMQYKCHLTEYNRRHGHLKRQTAKANNFFFKMLESDCYVRINKTDVIFYTYNKHFANGNGKGGAGYYARLKTPSGVINIKI